MGRTFTSACSKHRMIWKMKYKEINLTLFWHSDIFCHARTLQFLFYGMWAKQLPVAYLTVAVFVGHHHQNHFFLRVQDNARAANRLFKFCGV